MLFLVLLLMPAILHIGYQQCLEQNGYFPHERNCDMFYECRNGTAREGICPDGLVFDDRGPARYPRCDLPFEIDCTYRPSLQPPQTTEHCPRLWGIYAHETDCNRFWKCVDGRSYPFFCPEGLAYNEYRAHCDWPDQVDKCDGDTILGFSCPQPSEEEFNSFGDPRYPHPTDCRKHYVCLFGPDGRRHPRLLACDPGLVFNSETGNCDDAEFVRGCENYYDNLDTRRLRELFGG